MGYIPLAQWLVHMTCNPGVWGSKQVQAPSPMCCYVWFFVPVQWHRQNGSTPIRPTWLAEQTGGVYLKKPHNLRAVSWHSITFPYSLWSLSAAASQWRSQEESSIEDNVLNIQHPKGAWSSYYANDCSISVGNCAFPLAPTGLSSTPSGARYLRPDTTASATSYSLFATWGELTFLN